MVQVVQRGLDIGIGCLEARGNDYNKKYELDLLNSKLSHTLLLRSLVIVARLRTITVRLADRNSTSLKMFLS